MLLLLGCTTEWSDVRLEAPHVVQRLPPGELTLPSPTPGVDAAQLAQAVRRVKAVAPVNATIRIVPPFVLVGDEPEATVDARAALLDRTLTLFRADYFDVELDEPWEIWLFRDADSYRRNTYSLFNQYPTTPYGFADGNHRALVMNIATGGGTLVHELAHPYINAGIPWVPTWFNEGFASLFEQVGEEDGHLVGYLNWRLPTLQLHIEAGDVPDLAAFMAQDADTFRGERVALHYAMARYLCFYLQEHGKLQEYYAALKARPEDPTGYATLQRVLGEADMGDFQRRWEAWAMALE